MRGSEKASHHRRLTHLAASLLPSCSMAPSSNSAPADTTYIYHELSPADIAGYHRSGYLVTPPLVSPGGLERIQADAMRAWQQEKGDIDQTVDGLTWLQAALLPSVHRIAPACKDYYWHGPHLALVRQLIGPNVKTSGTQLSFKVVPACLCSIMPGPA